MNQYSTVIIEEVFSQTIPTGAKISFISSSMSFKNDSLYQQHYLFYLFSLYRYDFLIWFLSFFSPRSVDSKI